MAEATTQPPVMTLAPPHPFLTQSSMQRSSANSGLSAGIRAHFADKGPGDPGKASGASRISTKLSGKSQAKSSFADSSGRKSWIPGFNAYDPDVRYHNVEIRSVFDTILDE